MLMKVRSSASDHLIARMTFEARSYTFVGTCTADMLTFTKPPKWGLCSSSRLVLAFALTNSKLDGGSTSGADNADVSATSIIL